MIFHWPWFRHGDEKPDPAAARRQLERIREQRPEVDALRAAYRAEHAKNHFGANITAALTGRRSRP